METELTPRSHYCEHWDDCEYYEDGYCWGHEKPVDDIDGPCYMDECDN